MFEANNAIIEELTPPFVAKVNAAKNAMNIKHNRTDPPHVSKFAFKKQNGEISRISLFLNKGEIMTHKGVGGRGSSNRIPKPFFTPAADEFTNELADRLAEETGNTICRNLCI